GAPAADAHAGDVVGAEDVDPQHPRTVSPARGALVVVGPLVTRADHLLRGRGAASVVVGPGERGVIPGSVLDDLPLTQAPAARVEPHEGGVDAVRVRARAPLRDELRSEEHTS